MICKYRQWRISQAVDGGHPLPSGLRRHVIGCPGCAAHHEEQRRVAALLTRAGGSMQEAPPFLKERILNAVAAEAQPAEHWLIPDWIRVAIGAAAIAALAWVLIPRLSPDPAIQKAKIMPGKPGKKTTAPIVKQSAAIPPAKTLMELPGLPNPPVEFTLSQLGDSFTAPYTTELNNLKNDLANTRDFLGNRLASLGLAGFKAKP